MALDQYGGYTSLPLPGATGGRFRVAKLGGGRWVFVTPLGNAFWSNGVFDVTRETSPDDIGRVYNTIVQAKYGSTATWAQQQKLRFRAWGFSAMGEYLDASPDVHAPWDDFAKHWIIKFFPAGFTNAYVTGIAQPTKEIVRNGTNPTYYTGYRGYLPDTLDPYYAQFVNAYIDVDHAGAQGHWYPHAYTVTVIPDDRDYFFTFGPDYTHPHLGWIILVTAPTQTSNSEWSVSYPDTTVYCKAAFRDQLIAKYGTIGALNAAWGSSYTTFGSDGGWGPGSGLLDEDGRHAWVPTDPYALTGAPQAMVDDFNAILLAFARSYFQLTKAAIRKWDTNVLIGMMALNSEGQTRPGFWQAAGEHVDVGTAQFKTQTILNTSMAAFGDKPVLAYDGTFCNADSDLWRHAGGGIDPERLWAAQAARGAGYVSILRHYLAYTVTATGVKPFAGIKWWECLQTLSGEFLGGGVMTLGDNPFDGQAARIAAGTDQWGYSTGGEERDYGDFLTGVLAANNSIEKTLLGALLGVPILPSWSPSYPAIR